VHGVRAVGDGQDRVLGVRHARHPLPKEVDGVIE